MRAFCLLSLCFLCLGLCGASAQISVRHNAIPNPEIFGIQLGAGQELYCRVRGVNSVSLQRYLTPAYSVVEMVIDVINSPLQIRIYSTEPIDAVQRGVDTFGDSADEIPMGAAIMNAAELGLSQASQPVQDRMERVLDRVPVVKNYPATTHSKTIEYKLPSPDAVVALFQEFNAHWLGKAEAVEAATSSDVETDATGRINPLSRALFTYSEE